MAQPNVAREPSMEEILASIRRIIESNEPNGENALSGQLPPVYGEDDTDEPEETSFVPDMVANDRGVPQRNEPMNYGSSASSQSAQPERTLSLADVAARVRAASARQQETGSVRPATSSIAPAAPAPVRQEEQRPLMPRMPEFRETLSAQPAPAMPSTPMAHSAPPMQAAPAMQPVAQNETAHRAPPSFFDPIAPAPALARTEAPVRQEPKFAPEPKFVAEPKFAPEPKFSPEPQSLPAKIEAAANLLSAEAGAHVAQSFSELASVFNGMERRSLEDMAGDMLRPMLQEWLDDNLPTLVERLVREEIERVARGPRR